MTTTQLSTQGLVPGSPATIEMRRVDSKECDVLQNLFNSSNGPKLLGVSLRHTEKGRLDTVALSTVDAVYLVSINASQNRTSRRRGSVAPSTTNLTQVLENPHCMLVGFGMARVALLLHRGTEAHVRGVDLSTLHSKSTREQISAAKLASTAFNSNVPQYEIHALWIQTSDEALCLRAWLSALIAERRQDAIASASKIDTRNLRLHELSCLSQLVLNVELLDADKPTSYENEFEQVSVNSEGQLELRNARYNTRIRNSGQTIVEINGGQTKALTFSTKGRQTVFTGGTRNVDPSKVHKVRVVGRQESTSAELGRDEFLLLLLQNVASLAVSPFIRLLWFHNGGKALKEHSLVHSPSFEELNDSQRQVALAMIGDAEPLVIAHGPPGTGKTTTIAAALDYWQGQRQPAWVVAQSNVGVKNIAVSLFKREIDFRIIVSKEFHFDWHEHIYDGIEHKLIRTDEFGKKFDPRLEIGETKVILCTLSMLSNPALEERGVFAYVPVERLVVDEASQIDTFEFMHLFHKFSKKLEKVCMFGDPKQLPPFGKEVAPNMKTIFDFKQFHSSAYFLDTQYRMPVPLGKFISQAVYEFKLKSDHEITDHSCVLFIDVRKGQEARAGKSWKNMEEVHAIVNIVKNYYQHKHDDLCIITPYDGQRAAIVTALKAANLPSEQVYNVDSFQGHEAPYVVVSVVRTSQPGFLQSLNRMNVMLTRCKTGMVLVTQRTFMRGSGRSTLLGRLATHWERLASAGGANTVWADAMEIADRRANLPGAPGKHAMQELTDGRASLSQAPAKRITQERASEWANPPAAPRKGAMQELASRRASLSSAPGKRTTQEVADGRVNLPSAPGKRSIQEFPYGKASLWETPREPAAQEHAYEWVHPLAVHRQGAMQELADGPRTSLPGVPEKHAIQEFPYGRASLRETPGKRTTQELADGRAHLPPAPRKHSTQEVAYGRTSLPQAPAKRVAAQEHAYERARPPPAVSRKGAMQELERQPTDTVGLVERMSTMCVIG